MIEVRSIVIKCITLIVVIRFSTATLIGAAESSSDAQVLELRLRQSGIQNYVMSTNEDENLKVDLTGRDVQSLDALRGSPVVELNVVETSVTNLQPLVGMQLKYLNLWGTPVSDLSPLTGMPLRQLHLLKTTVTDLSPLDGMSLESLSIDVEAITNGLDVISRMQHLYQICGVPKALCLAQVLPKRKSDKGMRELFERLDEESMDKLVAINPKKFIETYSKLFERIVRYEIVDLEPHNKHLLGVLCNNLGTAFLRLKKYKESRSYLATALSFDPDKVIFHRNFALSCVLASEIEHEKREKLLRLALENYGYVVQKECFHTPLGKEAVLRMQGIAKTLGILPARNPTKDDIGGERSAPKNQETE